MDNTPSLIESICIKDGKIQLLEYHNQRANVARYALYHSEELLDFSDAINVDKVTHDTTKCRIVYGEKIEKIEFLKQLRQGQVLIILPVMCFQLMV